MSKLKTKKLLNKLDSELFHLSLLGTITLVLGLFLSKAQSVLSWIAIVGGTLFLTPLAVTILIKITKWLFKIKLIFWGILLFLGWLIFGSYISVLSFFEITILLGMFVILTTLGKISATLLEISSMLEKIQFDLRHK